MSAAAGAGQPPTMIKDAAYYAEKFRRKRAKYRAKSGDSTDSDEEETIKRLVKEKLKAKKRKAKGLPPKGAGLRKYEKEREAKEQEAKPDIRSDTGVLAINKSTSRSKASKKPDSDSETD